MERQRAFWWRFEQEMEMLAWNTQWLLRAWIGNSAPTLDQMMGRTAPSMPDDPYGEVLRLIDPQAAREREWAKLHGIDTNEN